MTTTASTSGRAYAARYIAAVGRAVPAASRDEIVAELEGTIAELVEPRLAAGETRDDAERAVVEKETVPVERVRLGTETVTEQQRVDEQVRHEEIDTTDAVDGLDRTQR